MKNRIISGLKAVFIFFVCSLFLSVLILRLAVWVFEEEALDRLFSREVLFILICTIVFTFLSVLIHEIGYRKGEGELKHFFEDKKKNQKEEKDE